MCCSGVGLRLAAFLILIVAFVACCIGFFAPFWIQKLPQQHTSPIAPSTSSGSPSLPSTTLPPTPPIPAQHGRNESEAIADSDALALSGEQLEREEMVSREVGNDTSGDDRMFEGLWATCDSKFECRCFAQNNFELEKSYPPWHKAAQGLFTAGLLLLLVTLLIGAFYLCCRCCKESFALATILGVFCLISFLPIVLSLLVYGGFAYHVNSIQLTGEEDKFLWGYFVSIAGALVILLAALLYFLDGRRKIIIEHEDCETAKMV